MLLGVLAFIGVGAWIILVIHTVCKEKETRVVLTSFAVLITVLSLFVMFSINKNKADTTLTGEVIDLSLMPQEKAYGYLMEISKDPQAYLGKTIRLRGVFFVQGEETDNQTVHTHTDGNNYYCIVMDKDGNSIPMDFIPPQDMEYPSDFPPIQTDITIQGVFTAFADEEQGQMYCAIVME